MKILFVCRANVVRSQMAAAWYNHLTKSSDADSAGTIVDEPGQTLAERSLEHPGASYAVDVMDDNNIDISENSRMQVTPELLKHYDLVINMAADKYTPKWLSKAPNYVFWKINDPMGHSYGMTAKARDQIKKYVTELIESSK